MKKDYIVEYTRKSTLKQCADVFPTKSAAFKMTRDPSVIWERVIECWDNGGGRIIIENPEAENEISRYAF